MKRILLSPVFSAASLVCTLLLSLPAPRAEAAGHRLIFFEYGKGPNRLLELDEAGQVVWEHQPPSIAVIFEVLPNGNLLYAYGGKPTGVREVNRNGVEIWNYVSACPQVLGCRRLPNGNTLMSCGTQKRVLEVTPDKKVAWEFTALDAPEVNLTWVSSIQPLRNGNLLVGNFLRGQEGRGAHAFEVTRDKKVVWQWADHALIRSLTTVRAPGE